MKYIGLLTDEQKRAGYFVSQDEDFVWLWHSNSNKGAVQESHHPEIVGVFLYQDAKIKDIRELAEKHKRDVSAK